MTERLLTGDPSAAESVNKGPLLRIDGLSVDFAPTTGWCTL